MDQRAIVLGGARVVTPTRVLDPGWVSVREGRIVAVGTGHSSVPVDVDLAGRWLLAGFIDLHVHGGGGHDMTTSPEAMAAGVRFHRGRGTTRTLVSLMAQSVDAMCEQLAWAAGLARDGVIEGVHLEGPFLATKRCGAQNPAHLLAPDPSVARKLRRGRRRLGQDDHRGSGAAGCAADDRRARCSRAHSRHRPYRCDVRPGSGRLRRGRHAGHPPVQRDGFVQAAGAGSVDRRPRRRRAGGAHQ